MKNLLSKISPGLFGIIIFCFFLPFITVSCQNHDIVRLSGIQLVVGTEIKEPSSISSFDTKTKTEKRQKINSDAKIVVAFLSAIFGLVLSIVYLLKRVSTLPIMCGILASLGFLMLLFFKVSADNEILKQGQGILQLKYNIGFWLSLLLFLVNGIVNFYIYIESKKGTQIETK